MPRSRSARPLLSSLSPRLEEGGARGMENFEGCGALDAISIKSLTHTQEPIGPPTGPISSGGAPRLPAARSARAFQRRAPRVLCSSATASSAAPAGISSEFTASYLHLRSSLSCLIVRLCSHVRRSYLGYRHHFTSLPADTCPGPAQSRQCRSPLAGSVDACAAEQSRRTLAAGGSDLRRQHSNGCVDLLLLRGI